MTEAPPLGFDFAAPYGLEAVRKAPLLVQSMNALTQWHREHCAPYANAVNRLFGAAPATRREEVPYLPVRLFKTQDLASVPKEALVRTLTSSGTTGHASRIFLDRETASRQTRALGAIMTALLGSNRRRMLIVDSAEQLKGRTRFNARTAAVLGFSIFGRDHEHALNASLAPDFARIENWLSGHGAEPVFVFGFTSLVWQCLVQPLLRAGRRLPLPPGSVLLHGGGWKRLEEQAVSREAFRNAVRGAFGIEQVRNYYGMVEQVGSIHIECEQGHLHCPDFADVIVRDPLRFEPVPFGERGVVQVLSVLPVSYPGHSLLTEDLGMVHGEDDCACGRAGRHFTVHGRLPQAELRGCSDTRVLP